MTVSLPYIVFDGLQVVVVQGRVAPVWHHHGPDKKREGHADVIGYTGHGRGRHALVHGEPGGRERRSDRHADGTSQAVEDLAHMREVCDGRQMNGDDAHNTRRHQQRRRHQARRADALGGGGWGWGWGLKVKRKREHSKRNADSMWLGDAFYASDA